MASTIWLSGAKQIVQNSYENSMFMWFSVQFTLRYSYLNNQTCQTKALLFISMLWSLVLQVFSVCII